MCWPSPRSHAVLPRSPTTSNRAHARCYYCALAVSWGLKSVFLPGAPTASVNSESDGPNSAAAKGRDTMGNSGSETFRHNSEGAKHDCGNAHSHLHVLPVQTTSPPACLKGMPEARLRVLPADGTREPRSTRVVFLNYATQWREAPLSPRHIWPAGGGHRRRAPGRAWSG